MQRGREEVTKALELNEALADAHTCLASILLTNEDFVGSEREARRATGAESQSRRSLSVARPDRRRATSCPVIWKMGGPTTIPSAA